MSRRSLALFLAVVSIVACRDDIVAPVPVTPDASPRMASGDNGPPSSHQFGPDSYRIGAFTGAGTTIPGLTCSDADPSVRECSGYLASGVDGTLLDVTLEIPATATRPVPLVALIHGYAGSKTSSSDIADSLTNAGYAVLRYSTRGFGDSWGQVNLADLNAEIRDLQSMIGQVVDLMPSDLDASHVAVTGASYGGGHSWLAALQPSFETAQHNNVTIRTVIPIAAWSDLVYALMPNGRERESIDGLGGAKLSYVDGLFGSGVRKSETRPYPNYPDYFFTWITWIDAQEPNDADPIYRSIVDGMAGYRSIWWQQQFWRDAASIRLPVFIVQGFTDDLFPLSEAKRMVLALQTIDPGYPVALYLGDLGHPRAANKPGEVSYVLGLIRQWLGYYLKGEGSAPANVVYAAMTRPRDEPFSSGNVLVVATLGALATDLVTQSFSTPAVLVNPATDPLSGFFWDPLIMTGAEQLQPLPVPPDSPLVPGSLATYEVPVTKLSRGGALVIAGQPTVTVRATTAAYRVQLDVRLFDVDQSGRKQLITRGTYTLQGPVAGTTTVVIPTYGNYWRAESGHKLRLELTNVDSPYIAPSRVPSTTLVTSVQLDVPVRR